MRATTAYVWPTPKPPCIDESEWMAVQIYTTFHGTSHDTPHRHLLASALRKLIAHSLRSERTPIPCRWCQQDSCYCCPDCGHDVRVDHDVECCALDNKNGPEAFDAQCKKEQGRD